MIKYPGVRWSWPARLVLSSSLLAIVALVLLLAGGWVR